MTVYLKAVVSVNQEDLFPEKQCYATLILQGHLTRNHVDVQNTHIACVLASKDTLEDLTLRDLTLRDLCTLVTKTCRFACEVRWYHV